MKVLTTREDMVKASLPMPEEEGEPASCDECFERRGKLVLLGGDKYWMEVGVGVYCASCLRMALDELEAS